MVFDKTKTFNGRLVFDASSLNEIGKFIRGAGFSEIKIKIPEKGYKNISGREFTLEDFVALEYNFDAQILTAKSKDEVIKILFVNRSNAVSIFNDSVLPSGHSIASSIYVESNDPVRLIGLLDFVGSLLEKNSTRSLALARTQNYLSVLASLYLFGVFGLFFSVFNDGVFSKEIFIGHWFLSIVSPILFTFYLLYHIVHPGGLYVRKFEHPLLSFYRRISAGDLRNNLIIVFLVWIFKVVIAGIIIGVSVNLLSDPVRQFLKQIF